MRFRLVANSPQKCQALSWNPTIAKTSVKAILFELVSKMSKKRSSRLFGVCPSISTSSQQHQYQVCQAPLKVPFSLVDK